MIGCHSSELFGVEQQGCFVLNEKIAVFCSQFFGDSSSKAHSVPVRASPECPGSLPLSRIRQCPPVPGALWQVVALHNLSYHPLPTGLWRAQKYILCYEAFWKHSARWQQTHVAQNGLQWWSDGFRKGACFVWGNSSAPFLGCTGNGILLILWKI